MARLISLARRLTIVERTLVAWLLCAVVAGGAAVLVGVVFDSIVVAVVIVLAWELVALALVVIALQPRRRAVRTSAVASAGSVGWPTGLAEHLASEGAASGPRVEELRLVQRVAQEFRHELLRLGMRTRSAWLREPLVFLATAGRFDYATLAAIVGEEHAEVVLGKADPNLLVALSRLTFSQNLDEQDRIVSLRILEHVIRHRGFATLDRMNQVYAAERLILAGLPELALPIVSSWADDGLTTRLLTTDLLNPFGRGSLPSEQEEALWLDAINTVYEPVGLEPIVLKPSGETPYDRLDALRGEPVVDGPLITVIMTCYNPDHELVHAVDSVIAQTWQNWELLVVDDASPGEVDAVLDAVAASDPRIRVVRATENRGTYVRRNEAIGLATGDFVTMHDSDDWAHPRRLELQARHLLANPACVANLSYSLRTSERLTFVQERGAVTMRLTESSLMFRRAIVDRIGYFDSVRKGADSEYRERIEAAFAQRVPVVETAAPLALVRFTTGSLSGSDFADGWTHPARFAYRSARLLWQDGIRAGETDALLPFPVTDRPFPAPAATVDREPAPVELDVVVVLDARIEEGAVRRLDAIATELRSLADSGLRVGVLHIEAFEDERSHDALAPSVQRLINDGTIALALLGDRIHADVVVVRNASVLQTAPSTPSRLRAERTVVVVDPVRDVRGRSYARDRAIAEAGRLFGPIPEWVDARLELDYGPLLTPLSGSAARKP